ncbi:MAG: HAD-IC family P-type ATPase, partial [Chromatiales bacterium]
MSSNPGSIEAETQIPWHSLSQEKLSELLQVDIAVGLNADEAARRHERYGSNSIEQGRRRSLTSLFLHQFADLMIQVLIGAAIVAGLLGETIDALAILVILLLNAAIGTIQEFRAEKALAALRKMTSPNAVVRRNDDIMVLPASELVPGDLVLLEAGNLVPADLRLLEAVDLQLDESTLTGESQTVTKSVEPLSDPGLVLMERLNMAFKGTHVTRGRGLGVTVGIGKQTELGRIASLLSEATRVQTPLQKRLALFSKR